MTVSEVLTNPGVDRLDGELMLAHVLRLTRTGLMTASNRALTDEELSRWNELRTRRVGGEPVAYITGTKEFYGRPFAVSRATLIPRPSTEGLVTGAMSLLSGAPGAVIETDAGIAVFTRLLRSDPVAWADAYIMDIGCGSGCIGITLALENAGRRVSMVDLSSEAVEIARSNALALGVTSPMRWTVGDGSTAVAQMTEPFILVSNPPYIPSGQKLMRDVADFEPHAALFSGDDGLAMIRPLLTAAKGNACCLGVALECRMDQITEVERLLA